MDRRRGLRIILMVFVAVSVVWLINSYITHDVAAAGDTIKSSWEKPPAEREQLVPATGKTLLVTGLAAPHTESALVAFGADGKVIYYEDELSYGDVDPVPTTNATIVYVASKSLPDSYCKGQAFMHCKRNLVRKVNISTGDRTTLYERVIYYPIIEPESSTWHDVHLINDTHLLVGDIKEDRVYIVNLRTEMITWEWDAQQAYDIETGGPKPFDWTHLNDVQYLENGRIMVSMRNHDQVIFIRPGEGIINDWTIGANDDYSRLHEQHNPDYINQSAGGPAVVISDSENDRIIEYQRQNSGWIQSWIWQDSRLNWPRDADRLPNGSTLITDTHGDRIMLVTSNGQAAWSFGFNKPYEAEFMPHSDEGTNGPAAQKAKLDSRTVSVEQSSSGSILKGLFKLIPQEIRSGAAFIMPNWVTFLDLLVFGVGIFSLITIGIDSVLRRGYRVQWPITKHTESGD